VLFNYLIGPINHWKRKSIRLNSNSSKINWLLVVSFGTGLLIPRRVLVKLRIFGYQEEIQKKALDLSSKRFKQIANNITNVNTPYYQAEVMNFEEELQAATARKTSLHLTNTHPVHIAQKPLLKTATTYRPPNTIMRSDQNNVDIEQEIAALIENNIYYSGVTTGLSSKFRLLQSVVQGGRQ